MVWGGVYLLRALGRSDDHHLMSALPPACLVLAHVCWLATRGILATPRRPLLRAAAVASAGALLFAGWVYAQRVDLYLERSRRGAVPIRVTNGAVSITSRAQASRIDRTVRALKRSTRPQDVVLDQTGGPLLHGLSGRAGPGYLDVVIPGIFLDESEERALLERLRSAPPVAVIWPRVDFDDMSARSIERTAPLVAAWVLAHYEEGVVLDEYAILRRRGGQPPHPPALEEKPLDGKDREDG